MLACRQLFHATTLTGCFSALDVADVIVATPPRSLERASPAKGRFRLLPPAVLHCIAVFLLEATFLGISHVLFFHGLESSDGLNYAVVARNVAEGHGLSSSVIQPGLMTIVPSTRAGQPFIIQEPLWPLVLGAWFRLVGASVMAIEVLSGLLFVGIAL